MFADDELCPHCKAPIAWRNCVDNTNGQFVGTILEEDWESLVIDPEKYEVCNLGHRHLIREARYRIPTESETERMRKFLNEDGNWVRSDVWSWSG
jgi:hypothetical protein